MIPTEQQIAELVAEVTGTRGSSEETARIHAMVAAARRSVAVGMSSEEVLVALVAALVERWQTSGRTSEAVEAASRRGVDQAISAATKAVTEELRQTVRTQMDQCVQEMRGLTARAGEKVDGLAKVMDHHVKGGALQVVIERAYLEDSPAAMKAIEALTVDRDRRIEQQAAASRRAMLAGLAVAVLVFVLVAVLGQLQVGRWATAQVMTGLLTVEEAGRREVTIEYQARLNEVHTQSGAGQILGEAVAEATARSRLGAVAVLEEVEGGLWMGPWLVVGIAVLVVVTALGVGGWWWGNRPGPG